MRIMTQQAQHDQVRVEAIQTVPVVGIVIRLGASEADVLHNLVLALTRHFMARQDDLHISPVGILGNLLVDKISEVRGEFRHKFSACSDEMG
jgi:hypothetical protein